MHLINASVIISIIIIYIFFIIILIIAIIITTSQLFSQDTMRTLLQAVMHAECTAGLETHFFRQVHVYIHELN